MRDSRRNTHETIRARWLVGCDGANSHVRRTFGPDFVGITYKEEFLQADADLDWDRCRDELHR